MNDYRILVVDDEEDLCEILKFNLENEGYEVDMANSAEEALKMDIGSYNLLLLDVMMGEISGFKMASLLKKDKQTAQIPIIFITAKDTENDTVTGFNLGADDYISKPFSLREVIARVKAVLRRTQQGEPERAPEQISYKTLVIDIVKKKVSIDGEEAPLTKKEFEILLLLLQSKGRVFSREDILARIWSDEVYVLDRTIDVNITRLRKKIGIYGKPNVVLVCCKVSYKVQVIGEGGTYDVALIECGRIEIGDSRCFGSTAYIISFSFCQRLLHFRAIDMIAQLLIFVAVI